LLRWDQRPAWGGGCVLAWTEIGDRVDAARVAAIMAAIGSKLEKLAAIWGLDYIKVC